MKKMKLSFFLFFAVLVLLFASPASAHVMEKESGGRIIRFSHSPMDPESGKDTTILLQFIDTKTLKEVRGLDVDIELLYKGAPVAKLKASEGSGGRTYSAKFAFQEAGVYDVYVIVDGAKERFYIPVSGSKTMLIVASLSLIFAIGFFSIFFIENLKGEKKEKKHINAPKYFILKIKNAQIYLQYLILLLYFLLIYYGFTGTKFSAKNPATLLVWSIWWSGIILLIPFLGRFWCVLCPYQSVMRITQRVKRFLGYESALDRDAPMPGKFRRFMPALALLVAVSWLEIGFGIVYSPKFTALLLVFLVLFVVFFTFKFPRFSFCREACFIGAIQGTYSMVSPLEVSRESKPVCISCKSKPCIKACPVFLYPGGMERSNVCMLCMNCVEVCPYSNLSLKLRSFASELFSIRRFGRAESLFIFSLFGITLLHGITMFPAWSLLRGSSLYFLAFTAVLLASIALPAVLAAGFSYASSKLAQLQTRRELFSMAAYAFVPLSLSYHLSHNLMHLVMEVPPALGFFITTPMSTITRLQILILLTGFAIACAAAVKMPQFSSREKEIKASMLMIAMLMIVEIALVVLLLQPMGARTT